MTFIYNKSTRCLTWLNSCVKNDINQHWVQAMQSNPNENLATSNDSEENNHSSAPSRRKLLRLGAAPLILTIPGRSALAGACLSNQLSGRDYQGRGECSKGWSPGSWGQPGGNIYNYSTTDAWAKITLNYGNRKLNCRPSQDADKCWTGGSTMSQIPPWLNKNVVPGDVPVRKVLAPAYFGIGKTDDYKPTRHLIAAYMNAQLSEVEGSAYNYVLTVDQLEKLVIGELPLPTGFSTLQDFLNTTW